jgi:hypothetical protein
MCLASAPKIPPPPPPPKIPQAPTEANPAVQAARKTARARALSQSGFQSTILSGRGNSPINPTEAKPTQGNNKPLGGNQGKTVRPNTSENFYNEGLMTEDERHTRESLLSQIGK